MTRFRKQIKISGTSTFVEIISYILSAVTFIDPFFRFSGVLYWPILSFQRWPFLNRSFLSAATFISMFFPFNDNLYWPIFSFHWRPCLMCFFFLWNPLLTDSFLSIMTFFTCSFLSWNPFLTHSFLSMMTFIDPFSFQWWPVLIYSFLSVTTFIDPFFSFSDVLHWPVLS